MTAALWFNTTDSTLCEMFGKNDGGSHAGSSYEVILQTGNTRFEVDDGSGWYKASYAPALNNGAWHQLVGTWDGSNVKLYIDGTLEDTEPAAITIQTTAQAVNIASSNGNNLYYAGSIDDVRFYNRALSSSDVAQLYAYTGVAAPKPPVLTVTGGLTVKGGLTVQ